MVAWERASNNDVVHVILLDLGCKVDVDLNPILSVLLFDGMQEGMEPFRSTEITDDPREVHLNDS